MANNKLSDKPITREALEAFIKTQDDFALELYAYQVAREHGFVANHAGSYSDRITGKTRQYDVRASIACTDSFHINFAIECKAIRPSFPILVSQIPRIESESYQDVVIGRGRYSTTNGDRTFVYSGSHKLTKEQSLYWKGAHVGKALVQVGMNESGGFVSNDYEVFDKWGQAIASASGLIQNAARKQRNIELRAHVSVVIPVLVVPDSTLWTVDYDDAGNLQNGPKHADEVQFYIGNEQRFNSDDEDFSYNISHMHIVTTTGLFFLLQRFSRTGEGALKLLYDLP